jgi:hypothetical protein
LIKITRNDENKDEYDRIRGSALFFRAMALHYLAGLFCQPYTAGTASQMLGVPVPLTSDVNIRPGRGTLVTTYNQILADLKTATTLLPFATTLKSRPSRPAALALLSRVYLTMNDYDNALISAESCLTLKNSLLNYNELNQTTASPFPSSLPNGNDEVLFHAVALGYSYVRSALTGVDSNIFRSFAANDIRRAVFFNPPNVNKMIRQKNSYAGSSGSFAGLALDEVYFNKAECLARKNEAANAMITLNTISANRYQKATFTNFTAATSADALRLILQERGKEIFTNAGMLRWMDLRRLNQDSRFAFTLKRNVNGQVFVLSPNDPRYTYPIPDNEISGSGIPQNPR